MKLTNSSIECSKWVNETSENKPRKNTKRHESKTKIRLTRFPFRVFSCCFVVCISSLFGLKIFALDKKKDSHSTVLFTILFSCRNYSPRAFAALMRPPVSTLPSSAGILSTDFKTLSRSFSTDRFGSFARIRAATPETYGVAIEVPDASR